MSAYSLKAAKGFARNMTDEELFDLHRYVSQLASAARRRDPEYRRRFRLGMMLARARTCTPS